MNIKYVFILIQILIYVCYVFFIRDLSENVIQVIPRRAFRGATDIRNLWVL